MSMQDYIAAVVAVLLFGLGANEYHQYRQRVEMCQSVETLAIAFNRTLNETHRCREYVDAR